MTQAKLKVAQAKLEIEPPFALPNLLGTSSLSVREYVESFLSHT